MILYGFDRVVAKWAGDRLGIDDFGPCSTIGIMRNGRIAAAAVFSRYSWPDISITFIREDPRWATPDAVRAVFRYPFVQLGCKRLTALTEATNQPTRAFLCRLGFQEEGRHPDAFESGEGISYGLLRKDAARWLAEGPTGGQVLLAARSA